MRAEKMRGARREKMRRTSSRTLRGPRKRGAAAALAVVSILLLAAVLRLYDLSDVPAGLFCDEASIGNNAYSVLRTGRDEHGVKMPLYFRAFGEYKNPVYIYSAVPFIAVFGLDNFGLRCTSAFYGVLTVFLTYLLGRDMFNARVGLLSSLLLAISPWHIHFSRISFELISLPCFFILALWLFYRGLSSGGKLYFCLSGLSLGISLYTYAVARFFVPIFFIGFAAVYFKPIWRRKAALIPGVCVFLALCVPLINFSMKHPQAATARWHAISFIEKGQSLDEVAKIFWRKYLTHYGENFLFRSGDPLKRHSVRNFGELYPAFLPFIYIGVFFSLIGRKRPNLVLLWWLVIFPAAASLTAETPTATRTIVVMPAFELLVAYAVCTMMRLFSLIKWRWIGYPLAAGVFLFFVVNLFPEFKRYLRAYFVDYPVYAARGLDGFQHGYRDVIGYMESQRENYDLLMLTATNVNQPGSLALFYSAMDPAERRRRHGTGYRVSVPEEYGRYSLNNRVLYSLRPEDLKYFLDYEIKKEVVAPDGVTSFLVTEVRKRKPLLRDWMVLGLFANARAKEMIDIKAVDVKAAYSGKHGEIRWRRYRPQFANLDLNRYFSSRAPETMGNPEHVCAYLLTYILSPDTRPALLSVSGSDDHISIWLNKKSLAGNIRLRRRDACRSFAVALRPGANELLIKSCESIGDWNLQVSVTNVEGGPDTELEFNPEAASAPLRGKGGPGET